MTGRKYDEAVEGLRRMNKALDALSELAKDVTDVAKGCVHRGEHETFIGLIAALDKVSRNL